MCIRDRLKDGVDISINGKLYKTKKCKAQLLNDITHIPKRFVRDKKHGETSWLSITLTEGKFRQVRKMTAKLGFPTLRLVRVRVGKYRLVNMQPGDVQDINC